MNDRGFEDEFTIGGSFGRAPEVVLAEPVTPDELAPTVSPRPRRLLPLVLFLATCVSTTIAGGFDKAFEVFREASAGQPFETALLTAFWESLIYGLKYSVPVMVILTCHEFGHFLQARRYGVYCSYPFFIPVPLPPLGTMGAVIAMDPRVPNRKVLFDIGASGPLAGLVPTLIFLFIGLKLSEPVLFTGGPGTFIGSPLLFHWMSQWLAPPVPQGFVLDVHPMAFAGWAGLLLTTINLFPLGQLDGGHIFYALLGRRANALARLLFLVIIALVIWKQLIAYGLLIVLLALMRPTHPPTAQDYRPLGFWRTVLGWLTLAFVPLGFTPTPFIMPG